MATSEQAFDVIRTRLDGNKPVYNSVTLASRWPNETDTPLPATPIPFIYTEFLTDPADLVSAGGGRGNNRYRHSGRIVTYVFVPMGYGEKAAMNIADQVAAVFRSYRDTTISCFSATPYPGGEGQKLAPPGIGSAVTSYWCAFVEVEMFFDLIG